jgi:hypothetical protein
MSPEAQRIAIAEACGWTWKNGVGELRYGESKDFCDVSRIPDYLNDLNAMHEAEKLLYLKHWYLYETNLEMVAPFRTSRATATQRAEAFLRTLSLWHD